MLKLPRTFCMNVPLLTARHRDAVWRWQELVRRRVAPAFQSGAYRRAVERSLRARRRLKTRVPFFFGVIATIDEGEPKLSSRGRESFRRLRQEVGSKRVFLRGIGVRSAHGGINVRCWSDPDKTAG